MNKFICLFFALVATKALHLKRAYTCGSQDYFTSNNGEIASHSGFDAGHNYGKNLTCIWRIEAPQGQNVELVAKSFNVENDFGCDYDYLELFDGNTTNSPSLGKFCGDVFYPISSTQRFLTLVFVTDANTELQGFKLIYNFTTDVIHACRHGHFQCANGKCIERSFHCDKHDDCGDDSDEQNCAGTLGGSAGCASDEFRCPLSGTCIDRGWLCDGDNDCENNADENPIYCVSTSTNCGDTNKTGSTGTIISPNYPSTYPSDTHCTYYIMAPAGTKNIVFKFDNNFSLEPDSGCSYDFVSVSAFGGAANHGPYCGNVSPGEFTVPSDHAYVTFTADESDQYTGFRLDWKALQ